MGICTLFLVLGLISTATSVNATDNLEANASTSSYSETEVTHKDAFAPDSVPEYVSGSQDGKICWDAWQTFLKKPGSDVVNLLLTRNPPDCLLKLFSGKEQDNERFHNLQRFKRLLKERADQGIPNSQSSYLLFCIQHFAWFSSKEQDQAGTDALEWRKSNPKIQEIIDKAIQSKNGRLGIWPNNKDKFELSFDDLIKQGDEGDSSAKDYALKTLIEQNKNKLEKIVEPALRWANGDSDYAKTVVLQGVFEEMYNRKFVSLQGQALKLLEEYALKGNAEAFKLMRTKINIPQIKAIAKKPEIIVAANKAEIEKDTGGWENFLKEKGVIG